MDRIFIWLLLIGIVVGAPMARAQEAAPAELGEYQTGQLELSPEQARGAFDAYIEMHEKFSDSAFEDYESLSDFVQRAPEGPKLDAIIRGYGFASVEDWLPVINALEFTIGAYSEEQMQNVADQIKELDTDESLGADEKARVIDMLKASLPSENNIKVLQDMLADPLYGEKLKAFISEE